MSAAAQDQWRDVVLDLRAVRKGLRADAFAEALCTGQRHLFTVPPLTRAEALAWYLGRRTVVVEML